MSGFSLLLSALLLAAEPQVFCAQGEMAGEVTQTSVILQSRLTSVARLTDGDVPDDGSVRFEFFDENGKSPFLLVCSPFGCGLMA